MSVQLHLGWGKMGQVQRWWLPTAANICMMFTLLFQVPWQLANCGNSAMLQVVLTQL